MMSGKISVVMPVYNAEKFLGATLDCILAQTYKNLEIICVLDCPTDGTERVLDEYAARFSQIKVIKNETNLDLSITRNKGVAAATGEYIHFMDADDLLSPDFYEILITAARKFDADVAASDVFYEKRPRNSIWFKKSRAIEGANAKIRQTQVLIHGWCWRWLIRRDFWNAHELSFLNLRPMEDLPAMVPMLYYANRVALAPGAVYFYKNREGSIQNIAKNPEKEKKAHENRHKARAIVRDFMREHKIRRPCKLLLYIMAWLGK